MIRFRRRGGTIGVAAAGLILMLSVAATARPGASASRHASPGDAVDPPAVVPDDVQTVVFAGGCFWGVQGVFEHVRGVVDATSGYAGGSAGTSTYGQVETGRTGHAESVEVRYDPSSVAFDQLLDVFFTVAHDPTQVNRQGPDVGPQYRSAVWTTTPEQAEAVRAYVARLTDAHTFSRPIVTEVGPLDGFFVAETYHQDYLREHTRQPYIVINDLPKLDHLRRAFPELWRDDPVTWRRDVATHDLR